MKKLNIFYLQEIENMRKNKKRIPLKKKWEWMLIKKLFVNKKISKLYFKTRKNTNYNWLQKKLDFVCYYKEREADTEK